MIKKPNEIFLGEAIREMVNYFRLKDKMIEARIIGAWENVVGSMIAQHTSNLYIKKRKLYAVIDSSVIRNELSYARSKLVKLLNKEAGENVIDEVVLM
jgi:predicted nucleic acid-binding Zn ribbon protein